LPNNVPNDKVIVHFFFIVCLCSRISFVDLRRNRRCNLHYSWYHKKLW